MKLIVNQKEISIGSQHITLAELVEQIQLPPVGIAIAVNNKVVRKADWGSTVLRDGDCLTVITAVCGG